MNLRPRLDLPMGCDRHKLEVLRVHGFSGQAESLSQALGTDSLNWAKQHALILLLPDALAQRRTRAILDHLTCVGLTLRAAAPVTFDNRQLALFLQYDVHRARPLATVSTWMQMQISASVALLVSAPPPLGEVMSTSEWVRRMRGRARPEKRLLGTMRFGAPNAVLVNVHTTDDSADVIRELNVLFPEATALSEFVNHEQASPIDVALAYESRTAPNSLTVDEAMRDVRLALEHVDPPIAGVGPLLDAACGEPNGDNCIGLLDALTPHWRRLRHHLSPWTSIVLQTNACPTLEDAHPVHPFDGPTGLRGALARLGVGGTRTGHEFSIT